MVMNYKYKINWLVNQKTLSKKNTVLQQKTKKKNRGSGIYKYSFKNKSYFRIFYCIHYVYTGCSTFLHTIEYYPFKRLNNFFKEQLDYILVSKLKVNWKLSIKNLKKIYIFFL